MQTLFTNEVLRACLTAFFLAQASKLLVFVVRERQLNVRYLSASGGMPSSHASVVSALATRIGMDTGLSSIPFALAIIFAIVVMYDAAGVRRAVSIQARLLNRMLTELVEAQHFNERRLRELIGHTPFEVFVGALLGGLTAFSL